MNNSYSSTRFFKLTNTFLVVLMLMASCLLIPKYNAAYFTSTVRAMMLFTLAVLFGALQLFQEKKVINFYKADLAWMSLIVWTGASIFWSFNEIYAIYGLCTTTLLYLCYKSFEAIEWTSDNLKMGFVSVLGLCFLMAFGLEFYVLRGDLLPSLFSKGKDIAALHEVGTNFNWLGSHLIILFPFLLFRPSRFNNIIAVLIFIPTFAIVFVSNSAQVMLATIFLAIFYLFYQIRPPLKYVGYVVTGGIILLVVSLFIIYFKQGSLRGIFFVIDEFYSQNDRLWMWKNCLNMWLDAPFTGQGKNSWQLAVGEFGFNDCKYCLGGGLSPIRFEHAHNSIFQTLSELGVTGLILCIILAVSPLYRLWKQKIVLSPLAVSALMSLFLFFFLSLMYGVVYNFFNNFCGLTVLVTFNLAFLGKLSSDNHTIQFSLSSPKFYSVYSLLALSGLFFFYQFNLAEHHYREGNIQMKNQNYEAAEVSFNDAMTYWDQSQVYERLAMLHQKTEDYPAAISAFQKAIEKDPYSPKLNYRYGAFLFKNKDYKTAEAVALLVHQILPNYIQNEILLIRCYKRNGQLEKALMMRDALLEDLNKKIIKLKSRIKPTNKNISKKYLNFIKRLEKQVEVLNAIF